MKKKIAVIVIVLILIGAIVVTFIRSAPRRKHQGTNLLFINDSTLYDNNLFSNTMSLAAKEHLNINEYIDYYRKAEMTSSDLLNLVSNEGGVVKDEVLYKLEDDLRQAKYICLQIGYDDIKSLLNIDQTNNKIDFDLEVISRQLSILQNQLNVIVNEIQEIREDINIYLIGMFFPYNEISDLVSKWPFDALNHTINDVAIDNSIDFIDVEILEDKAYLNNNSLNENGVNKLADLIINKIAV